MGTTQEPKVSVTQTSATTSNLSRRGVMKAGLLGTAAMVIGGAALTMRATKMLATPAQGLHVLSAKEYSVLAAIADRVCPAAGEGAPGALALDVPTHVDQRLSMAEKDVQGAIKTLLNIFDNALTGALLGERIAPFTQLDSAAQDRVLAQWRASSLAFKRSAFGALNGLIASTYYGDPRTWARLGYDGPPSPAALRVGFAMNLVDYESLKAK